MFSVLQLFMKLAPTFLLRTSRGNISVLSIRSRGFMRFRIFDSEHNSRTTCALYPRHSNSRNPWVTIDALSTQLSEDRLVRLHLLFNMYILYSFFQEYKKKHCFVSQNATL